MSEPYRTYRGNLWQRFGLMRSEPELSGDADLPVWMHPIEFAQVIAVLATLAPTRIVEWGSGGSTRAWPSLVPRLSLLVSVEHHGPWYERVQATLHDSRVRYGLCLPRAQDSEPTFPPTTPEEKTTYRAWCDRCEEDPSIMADYIGYPASVADGVPFDIAFVDGRARVPCAAEALRILRPGGVVLVHDTQREEYHGPLAALGQPVYLEPWVQGQLCLIRKPDFSLHDCTASGASGRRTPLSPQEAAENR